MPTQSEARLYIGYAVAYPGRSPSENAHAPARAIMETYPIDPEGFIDAVAQYMSENDVNLTHGGVVSSMQVVQLTYVPVP